MASTDIQISMWVVYKSGPISRRGSISLIPTTTGEWVGVVVVGNPRIGALTPTGMVADSGAAGSLFDWVGDWLASVLPMYPPTRAHWRWWSI
jgi:hypothetical protein